MTDSYTETALSAIQRSMWVRDQMDPDSVVHRLGSALRVVDEFDPALLHGALQCAVDRHPLLRASIIDRDGEPCFMIADHADARIEMVVGDDWSDGAVQRFVDGWIRRPYEPGSVLFRIAVIKRSESEHFILFGFHHIVVDFWSLAIVFAELSDAYERLRSGDHPSDRKLRSTFAEHVAREATYVGTAASAADRKFWEVELSGVEGEVADFRLPDDHGPSEAHDDSGAVVALEIGSQRWSRLQQLARSLDATPLTVTLAVFSAVLHRYSGSPDIPIMTVRANRSTRSAFVVGCFVNPVVLRTHVVPGEPFGEFVARVTSTTASAFRHSTLPFAEVLARHPQGSDASALGVAFNWQKTTRLVDRRAAAAFAVGQAGVQLKFGGLDAETVLVSHRPAPLPLSMLVSESDQSLQVAFEYQIGRFDQAAIERLAEHFSTSLDAILDAPETPIDQLDVLTAGDWESLHDEWAVHLEDPAVEIPVHEQFELAAACHSTRVAVRSGDTVLSYGDLRARADQLAGELLAAGVSPGNRVGILLERSADMVAAVIAVFKVGAAYVPLDPEYPAERITFMAMDSGSVLILTDRPPLLGLENLAHLDISARSDCSGITPRVEVGATDLAYVAYTSGSTGKPKGVEVEHGSVSHRTAAMSRLLGIDDETVLLAQASLSFDSIADLFMPLLAGGQVVVVPHAAAVDGRALREALVLSRATVMDATPSSWRLLIESGWMGGPGLTVVCGGEELTPDLAGELLARAGTVWNAYGPTETTVYTTFQRVGPDVGAIRSIPIGSPLPGARVYVLDDHRQPVPDGTIGELYIAGSGVARGYHGLRELTAERFVPDPFHPGQRMYRTGDLAHREQPGVGDADTEQQPRYYFHGRKDNQIKLRGYRIELGEIEATLNQHPQIAASAVVTHDHAPGDTRLVAYVTVPAGATAPTAGDVRAWCQRSLPDHMIPTTVSVLDQFPLTPTSKIDRNRLPAPSIERTQPVTFEAPRAGLETDIANIWIDVLGTSDIGRHDNFFDLGGHSLLATKIASRLRSQRGLAVSVRNIFEHPSVAALADAIGLPIRLPPLPAVEVHSEAAVYPLSYSQERMWFLHQIDPDGLAYRMTFAARLRGPLDIDACRRAINAIVDRHDSLRTVFDLRDGAPVQRVVYGAQIELDVVDMTHLSPSMRWPNIRSAIDAEARRAFRLDRFPLIRFLLYRVGQDDHGLFVSMHHIISDEWSVGLMAHEFVQYYTAEVNGTALNLPDPPVRAVDYARWHRSLIDHHLLDDQIEYWREQLNGIQVLELPSDRARPAVTSSQGATVISIFPPELRQRLDIFCRAQQVSPFMVLLAAFQLLLARTAATADVPVGTAIANRNWLESEGLIASLVNTVVIRTDTSGSPAFVELLRRVEQTALDAFAHQDVPFARLVAELNTAGHAERPSLYRAFFNVLNGPFGAPTIEGVDVEHIPIDRGATQIDLSLAISTSVDLAVVEYDTDLFDHDRIERLVERYWQLLDAAMSEPYASVDTLPMLTGDDWKRLRAEWSSSRIPGSEPMLVHESIAATSTSCPDSIAVRCGRDELTYRELDSRADQLAGRLVLEGVGKGDRVGILLDRTPNLIVAVTAVLKAGAAFVPLDPDHPDERITYMATDAGCGLVITDLPLVAGLAHVARLDPSVGRGDGVHPVATVPITASDLAYVMYTSGSTGQPKGVEVEHRHLSHYLQGSVTRPGMTADDVVLAITTLSFDPSVTEILLPLTAGATIELVPRSVAVDGPALGSLIERTMPTFIQATPSSWRLLIESGWMGGPGLTVVCGGEELTPDLAGELLARAGTVWNAYGPTETTVYTTFQRVGPDVGAIRSIPIGSPLPGARVYVLDDHRQPVPDGTIGELYIAGSGVARGYHGLRELTAERFVPDPFHPGQRMYRTGDLAHREQPGVGDADTEQQPRYYFHGRKDNQIKLRGYRIELGEIEATLNQHPQIAASAVVTHDHAPGDTRLVAYVTVPAGATAPTAGDVRAWCQRSLPDHMIPTTVSVLDQFPLTPTSKIDRNRLPAPSIERTQPVTFEAPRAGLETDIANIWIDVLGTSDIGRHDNFFDLGGHSLLAIRVFAELDRRLGLPVRLSALFEAPTVALLSELIQTGESPQRWTSLIPVQPHGSRRPFFYVAPYQITALSFSNLGRGLASDQPLYVLQPQGLETPDPVHFTVESMATHYISEMRDVQPDGPYLVGGHCSGSAVAFEMARQLQAAGDDVELLVLVDAIPPGPEPERTNTLRYVIQRLDYYRRDGRLLPAVSWWVKGTLEQLVTRRVGRRGARRVAQLRSYHAAAHAAYSGSPIRGDAVLVRSDEWHTLREYDWHLRWADLLSGELSIVTVPGTHAGLVEVANSAALATVIEAAIASVDDAYDPDVSNAPT